MADVLDTAMFWFVVLWSGLAIGVVLYLTIRALKKK